MGIQLYSKVFTAETTSLIAYFIVTGHSFIVIVGRGNKLKTVGEFPKAEIKTYIPVLKAIKFIFFSSRRVKVTVNTFYDSSFHWVFEVQK